MEELKIFNGDCLEVMKTLPNKSVDLFICDLPYGCLSNSKNNKRERYIGGEPTGTILEGQTIGGCDWDVKIDLVKFWEQVKRLCKNEHTPVIMFCNTRFGCELINSNPDWFRYDLVWSKSNGVGFLSANKMPLRSHEMIYVFSKKGAFYKRIDITGDFPKGGGGDRRNAKFIVADCERHTTEAGRRCVKSVVEVTNKKEKGQHPTAKSKELYKWLIERYSNEGDTMLDPTAGSFNSCVSAVELKRKAIGIEKDETFFNKFKSKIESDAVGSSSKNID